MDRFCSGCRALSVRSASLACFVLAVCAPPTKAYGDDVQVLVELDEPTRKVMQAEDELRAGHLRRAFRTAGEVLDLRPQPNVPLRDRARLVRAVAMMRSRGDIVERARVNFVRGVRGETAAIRMPNPAELRSRARARAAETNAQRAERAVESALVLLRADPLVTALPPPVEYVHVPTREERLAAAVAMLRVLHREEPSHVVRAARLAEALARNAETQDEAFRILSPLVTVLPDIRAYATLAYLYAAHGDRAEAIRLWRRCEARATQSERPLCREHP